MTRSNRRITSAFSRSRKKVGRDSACFLQEVEPMEVLLSCAPRTQPVSESSTNTARPQTVCLVSDDEDEKAPPPRPQQGPVPALATQLDEDPVHPHAGRHRAGSETGVASVHGCQSPPTMLSAGALAVAGRMGGRISIASARTPWVQAFACASAAIRTRRPTPAALLLRPLPHLHLTPVGGTEF